MECHANYLFNWSREAGGLGCPQWLAFISVYIVMFLGSQNNALQRSLKASMKIESDGDSVYIKNLWTRNVAEAAVSTSKLAFVKAVASLELQPSRKQERLSKRRLHRHPVFRNLSSLQASVFPWSSAIVYEVRLVFCFYVLCIHCMCWHYLILTASISSLRGAFGDLLNVPTFLFSAHICLDI